MPRANMGKCPRCMTLLSYNGNSCAHQCPHGKECTFKRVAHRERVVDFSRLECEQCTPGARKRGAVTKPRSVKAGLPAAEVRGG